MRALDATPDSAAGLGLATFEPSFTREPQFAGGPKIFYGMLLVVSLVVVLVLALGLTAKQAFARHRWLATATAAAGSQSRFADPGAGGGAAGAEEGRDHELTTFRVSRMWSGRSGAELPESGLMETLGETATGSGGSPAAEPEPWGGEAADGEGGGDASGPIGSIRWPR